MQTRGAMSPRDLRRTFDTVRHLRARQIWYQARHRLRRPTLTREASKSYAPVALKMQPGAVRRVSYTPRSTFEFLNERHDLGVPIDWNAEQLPLLWRYNLHYFDFLHQPSMGPETGFALMDDWVAHHTPAAGAVGWQPYTLSLRIVNWLKFMSGHGKFPRTLVESLAVQTENLERQIEYHILGNHLFANAKALWFAGAFLANDDWLRIGRNIVLEQLPEQFLPDGGHFELSPMYHALAVEDLLDLVNLCVASGDQRSAETLREYAQRALGWLGAIVNDAGRLPLLNDSAEGIAPDWQELSAYAERLNIPSQETSERIAFQSGWTGRELSGYWVVENADFRLVFDTARLGPDYLPGHAHCDMLSILLNFRGDPILADTGVFEYAESQRRTHSRSAAAHNTVALDDLEQGDIWKSFRMGRRGHPRPAVVTGDGLACAHDGFAKWVPGLAHERTLTLVQNGFEIRDAVKGPANHRAVARYHFAPGVNVAARGDGRYSVGKQLTFEVMGAHGSLATSEYYPEFGLVEVRTCLVVTADFEHAKEFVVRCTSSS